MRPGVVFACVVAAGVLAGAQVVAAATPAARTLIVSLRVGQCAIASATDTKTASVTRCANPKHNLEIYAVEHGGWGHKKTPPRAKVVASARTLCVAAFEKRTGHSFPTDEGWRAFWIGSGNQKTRYGDRLICGLSAFPVLRPLGAGRHV
jgi:hypothetical protein